MRHLTFAALVASSLGLFSSVASANGPIVGIAPGKLNPECKVFRMKDGTSFQTGGNVVKAGGTCPASYPAGRQIDGYTIKLDDGRTCKVNESGTGRCS